MRFVTTFVYLQSGSLSKHIGVCSVVNVNTKTELDRLLAVMMSCEHGNGTNLQHCPSHMRISFNEPICGLVFPASLHTLSFGFYFNHTLANVTLPTHLHTLTFGLNFNQSFAGVTLPPTLHMLKFGDRFNRSSGLTLPASLHTLAFGACFNQPLDAIVFPSSLQALYYSFNQSLVGIALPRDLSIHRVCSISNNMFSLCKDQDQHNSTHRSNFMPSTACIQNMLCFPYI